MHLLALGDTFAAMDGLDALAILMLIISLLAMLASVRVSQWTDRLAAANQLNRQLKQDRHQKRIRHNLQLYRGVGERLHSIRARTQCNAHRADAAGIPRESECR